MNIPYLNNYHNKQTSLIGGRANYNINPASNFQIKSGNKEQISFQGNFAQRLTNVNIGMFPEGFIGCVKLRKAANNEEVLTNVFKSFEYNREVYQLKDNNNNVIGEAKLRINKFWEGRYDKIEYPENPSHVFVDDLYNYSKPNTPYNNSNLEELKDAGLRLLQIAQRRSDEAQCTGNVRLISMPEAKSWYMNYIGMQQLHKGNSNLRFDVQNPNILFLPPHAKEPLSKLEGGL